jgi:hypothetical protein
MTQPDDVMLRVAKLAALACSIAAAIYAGVRTEPSPVGTLLLSGGPLLAVILWLQKDARRTGVGAITSTIVAFTTWYLEAGSSRP